MNTNEVISTADGETDRLAAVSLRCIACKILVNNKCDKCDLAYDSIDGIITAIEPLGGANKVAAEFYDSPGWVKFRPWEKGFLAIQGGQKNARMQILQYLNLNKLLSKSRVLEVGIGDGENVSFFSNQHMYGVDIARSQLETCLQRYEKMNDRLFWAQGEQLPFADDQFDASYSIGGFTHFGDPARAWREMRRVTKSGGLIVIADELPNLHKAGLGHLIGRPAIDRWWLTKLGLSTSFIDLVFSCELKIHELIAEVSPTCDRRPIWFGMGYCLIDRAPSKHYGSGVS